MEEDLFFDILSLFYEGFFVPACLCLHFPWCGVYDGIVFALLINVWKMHSSSVVESPVVTSALSVTGVVFSFFPVFHWVIDQLQWRLYVT